MARPSSSRKAPAPAEASFEAVLSGTARARDRESVLQRAGRGHPRHWSGFAELKRSLRSFPDTPLTERISGQGSQVR